MRISYVFLLSLLSVTLAETLPPKNVTTVDIVITGLKDQSWSEDEGPCLDQTLKVLNNVRNYTLWAVWIWNSMHHPVGTFYGSMYSLGNYDQCLNAPSVTADPKILTQYCLADVRLTGKKYEEDDRSVLGSTESYVATKTAVGRDLNKVVWGTCLPSTCKPSSISKILKTIYLVNPLTPSEPEITVDSCQVAGEKTENSFGYYAFMALMTSLVAVSVLSTYYLEYYHIKSAALHSIVNSFSMSRNWTSLVKKTNEEIGSLNLLKFLLVTLAVGVHTAFFEVMGPISNGLQFDEMILETKSPLKNTLKHVDLTVDNFFMISGLLLAKGLMEKKKNPLVSLVNRYFRLIGSFAAVVFYVAAVSLYAGDGPIWQRFASREQKACSDNWWLGLLMLNNYVNSENICLIVSWYIPCDYQLAVMGTILYLLWQKNKSMGKVVIIATVLLAFLMPGIVTYWKKLPGLILFHDIEKIIDFRKNEVYLDTYIRSHNRGGPYIIGMAMGYIISVYKPDKYRNLISKEWSMLLIAAASTVAIEVATAPLSWVSLEYDHLNSALYAVFSRNLWALSFCVIIGMIEYGDVAAVRKFANWHGFTVLSRLAYGIYLTHSVILQQNMYSRRNLQQFDIVYSELLHSFGVMVVSIIFATLLWLFVETPLNNIVNIFINSGSKDHSRHQITKDKLAKISIKESGIDINKKGFE